MRKLTTALVVLFLATITLAADEWHIETVDSAGLVGEYTSLALDSSGRPHISYYDESNSALKYARWDGSSWHFDSVAGVGDGGWFNSLALDSSNHPNISYGFDDLRFARWNGSSWQIETVDSQEWVFLGSYNSLALDSDDYPHISYYYFGMNNSGVKYARWDGSNWHIETVDGSGGFGLGKYTSLALDSSGYPHISYSNQLNNDLEYARWNGSSWQIQTVDSAGAVGLCTSLELDSSGRPHISYYDESNSALKYARWNGSSWQIQTVDSEGDVGYYTSLALDSSGYPHISYYDDTNKDLKYARWNGSTWQIETVDSDDLVGEYTSLALDSYNNPHISYYYAYNCDLKYAWYGDESGVEDAELSAGVCDEGVLVGWTITGDAPAGFSVLRSAGEGEPLGVSGALPGTAARWLDADVEAGVEYRYWLEAVEEDGTVSRFGPTEVVTFPGAARELSLSVYPSPASGSFTVDYTLPVDGPITIALYDLSGRRVATVLDGEMTAGRHDDSYDASALPPGVYLARLSTDAGSLTERLVITR